MMSFNDVFHLLTVMMVMIIPLVFFMRQIYHHASEDHKESTVK